MWLTSCPKGGYRMKIFEGAVKKEAIRDIIHERKE